MAWTVVHDGDGRRRARVDAPRRAPMRAAVRVWELIRGMTAMDGGAGVVRAEEVKAALRRGLLRRGFVQLAIHGNTSYWRDEAGTNVVVDTSGEWPKISWVAVNRPSVPWAPIPVPDAPDVSDAETPVPATPSNDDVALIGARRRVLNVIDGGHDRK